MTEEERRVPAPQFVNGREVCAMVRLRVGWGEFPNQWAVICLDIGEETYAYIVWKVWYDGGYHAQNGDHDLTWQEALKRFAERFEDLWYGYEV